MLGLDEWAGTDAALDKGLATARAGLMISMT